MSQSDAEERPGKGCGWQTGFIALVVALIGLGATILAAGPDTVVEHTKAAFGSYEAPETLRVEPKGKPNAAYVVTLRNPSFEEVALLSYHVEPVASFAAAAASTNEGGSGVARVVAEAVPQRCKAGERDASLSRTIVIQPKKTMELVIHPWVLDQSCSFELRFNTSHGQSTTITVWEFDPEGLKKALEDAAPPSPPPPPPPPAPQG
jgi:hypothetical protein